MLEKSKLAFVDIMSIIIEVYIITETMFNFSNKGGWRKVPIKTPA